MKKNQNIIIFSFLLFFFTFILILLSNYQFISTHKNYAYDFKNIVYDRSSKTEYKDIKTGSIIKKNFKAKYNNLSSIAINFKKIGDTDIHMNIVLLNKNNNQKILEEEIGYENFSNNSYFLNFNPQKKSKNQDYELIITFEKVKENSTTIEYTNKIISDNDTTYIDGILIKGTLNINSLYKNVYINLLFYIITIGVAVVTIILSILIFKEKSITAEKAFLYVIPIICLMFMIVMPIFKGHDEQRHWLRAYEISEGHFLSDTHDGKVQTELPNAVINPLNEYWRYIDYNDIKKSIHNNIGKDTGYANMEYTAVYSPVQYLPQSIAIKITNIFTDRVLIMAYAARFANLVLTLFLLYMAIKLIPYGKNIMLLLSGLPLTIEACSTMSPDGLTISAAFLFISYILKLRNEKEQLIKKKDILILLLLSITLALCKIVYIPLVFLLILIPKEKFENRKYGKKIIFLILILSIILNLWWFKKANSFLAISSNGTSINQTATIFKHPIEYISIVLNTININGQRYLTSLFGGELGWNNFSLYFLVPYTYIFLFAFLSTTDKTLKNKFDNITKIISFCIFVIIAGLIFTSLYVQWTTPGKSIIDGVQGRYFIPIMPLVAFLLNDLKIKTDFKDTHIIKFIAITILLLQIYIFSTIVINHI